MIDYLNKEQTSIWCTPLSNDGGAIYTIVFSYFFHSACQSALAKTYSFAILGLCGWLERIANVYGFYSVKFIISFILYRFGKKFDLILN